MTARTVLALIGDTHIGSTVGLAPQTYLTHSEREDEATLNYANRAQRWLYDCWKDYWAWVRSDLVGIRGRSRKHRLVVVHLGDVVDGHHHKTPQVMPEIADQIRAAVDLLEPVADAADAFEIIYGTDAHNGGAGSFEIKIAEQLGAGHSYRLFLNLDGVTFDLAHHGRAGTRPWTSAARATAAEIQLEYLEAGRTPPRYVIRADRHVIDDSGESLETTRAIQTPAFQLRTAFGWKVAANKVRPHIGAIAFDGSSIRFDRARYRGAPGQLREVTPQWN